MVVVFRRMINDDDVLSVDVSSHVVMGMKAIQE